MLECVVNVSEGRDDRVLERIAAACAGVLLDLHRDPDHHRSVLTLGGKADEVESAARALTETAVHLLDLGQHAGAHPRFGVVDVVPFVPVPPELGQGLSADIGESDGSAGESGKPGSPKAPVGRPAGGPWVEANAWEAVSMQPAIAARDRFAEWAASTLSLPCFLYGPLAESNERTLPEVRRGAFTTIHPERGPDRPHPTAGAVAVGARRPLVAYNLWLDGADASVARRLASSIRSPAVHALGWDLGTGVQVSCNLVDPFGFGPADLYESVASRLSPPLRIERAELVGLIPGAVLGRIPPERWRELGVSADATIDARLGAR